MPSQFSILKSQIKEECFFLRPLFRYNLGELTAYGF